MNLFVGRSSTARSIKAALAVALIFACGAPASLAAGGDLTGRLFGPDDSPLAGYRIRLVGEEGSTAESRPTNSDGLFKLGNLPAGTYSFQILTGDYRLCEAQVAPAVIPEAGSVEVELRLERAPVCAGERAPASESAEPARRKGGGKKVLVIIGSAVALALLAGGGGGGSSEPPASDSSP